MAGGRQEVIRVAEQDEVGRAVGIVGNHVEQGELGRVGQRLRDIVVAADDRVEAFERGCLLLQSAGDRSSWRGIAVYVETRRVIGVHAERRRVANFRRIDEA
jgi:hypothetical protein